MQRRIEDDITCLVNGAVTVGSRGGLGYTERLPTSDAAGTNTN